MCYAQAHVMSFIQEFKNLVDKYEGPASWAIQIFFSNFSIYTIIPIPLLCELSFWIVDLGLLFDGFLSQ